MPVPWHDLLGIPWKLHGTDSLGMDCSTVAEEILHRNGTATPSTWPGRQARSAVQHNEMASYFGYLEDGFERVGDDASAAPRAGDLVRGSDEDGVARHLYVLVEPARGTFLTATHNHGVIAMRRFAIRRVVAVYRVREETP